MDDKLIKRLVKDILKSNDNKLSIKKLEKKFYEEINSNSDNSSTDIDFDVVIKSLTNQSIVIVDGKYVTLNNDKKRKRNESTDNDITYEVNNSKHHTNDINENNSYKNNNNHNIINDSNNQSIDNKSTYYKDLWQNGEKYYRENYLPMEYIKNNPDGITRLFCGNLNRKITEEQLKKSIDGITHIKWIVDKETKEFYGSTFVEMKDKYAAITAVLQDKTKILGRPLKIYYCPPKPGDVWPPVEKTDKNVLSVIKTKKPKTIKPHNCKKLFVGNLSYEIDDDAMVEFFKDCGELIGLRWLINKDTGEFRGSGYVEFATSEEAEKAFLLDGKILLGRPVNLDWTE